MEAADSAGTAAAEHGDSRATHHAFACAKELAVLTVQVETRERSTAPEGQPHLAEFTTPAPTGGGHLPRMSTPNPAEADISKESLMYRRTVKRILVTLGITAGIVTAALSSLVPSEHASAQEDQDVVVGSGSAGTGTFVVDATSNPSGENASGTLSLTLAIGTFDASVTCLNAQGNEATVGAVVNEGSTGAEPGSGLILHVIDGDAIATADLLRLQLVSDPPIVCPDVEMIFGAPVTDGDVRVVDVVAPVTLSSLAAKVKALPLNEGIRVSLVQKLIVADGLLTGGHVDAACEQLAAFVRQVDAQAGRGIPTASVASLLTDAAAISAELAC
jgi:hypothetical protein